MKINISIDDVSPHPLSSTRCLDLCHELIELFPEIKFTLFVPAAYWRTVKQGTTTEEPLQIHKFADFCQSLRELSPKNFEVGYHGLLHGIPGKSDNDEFQCLSQEEAAQRFEYMKKIVLAADLDNVFKPIFRPPAWRMSPGSIRAAKDAGIEVLALSNKEYAKKTYDGEDEKFGRVVYYTCNPPFEPLAKFDKNEIVYHACEWDNNYFSQSAAKELSHWIHEQEQRDVEFFFLSET